MAISALTISQTNITDGSNLLPVHSPLIFLCEAQYTGAVPEYLYVDLYDEDDVLLETFKAIPYQDLLPTIRNFMFIADKILKSYMDDMNDFIQTNYSFTHVANITMNFKIAFRDPDGVASDDELEFTAIHAAHQFGGYPNMVDEFNNETDTYYTAENKPVYIYFYNDSELNTVTVEDTSFQEVIALDYDDTEFADFDDVTFTIDTIV